MPLQNLSAAVLAELDKSAVHMVHLVHFAFDSGNLYITNGPTELSYGGNAYVAAGDLLQIGSVRSNTKMELDTLDIVLSGANSANFALALTENYQDRAVTVYIGFLDSNYQLIADPFDVFVGRVDSYRATYDPERSEARVVWLISNHFIDWQRSAGRLLTDEDQQFYFPGDKGLEYMSPFPGRLSWGALSTDIKFPRDPTGGQKTIVINQDNKIDFNFSDVSKVPLVYGRAKVSGFPVFIKSGGPDIVIGGYRTIINPYLYVVYILCEGPIDSIESLFINDVISNDSRFDGLSVLNIHLGSTTQSADSMLTTEMGSYWTIAHQLKGLAYVAARFYWNPDKKAFSGIPTLSAVVRGRTLYDPRTSSTVYSNNAALVLRDYLTNTLYGRGLLSTDLYDSSFIAAANYCERSAGQYQQIIEAVPAANAFFGACSALSDDAQYLVANAPNFNASGDYAIGDAWLYTQNVDGKTYGSAQALPVPAGTTAVHHYAREVTISGDGALIFANAVERDAGVVYVIDRATLTIIKTIAGTDLGLANGSKFGWKLAPSYDGQTLLVTAPFAANGGTLRGIAYILDTSSGWVSYNTNILNLAAPADNQYFGYAGTLSRDGLVAVCGDFGAASYKGRANVFIKSTSWPATPGQSLAPTELVNYDYFAVAPGNLNLWAGDPLSLSYDGTFLAVGAMGTNTSNGKAYLYRLIGGSFVSYGSVTPDDGGSYYLFAYALALTSDGRKLLIGSQGENSGAGVAYLFKQEYKGFGKVARFTPTTPQANSYYGFTVAISGEGYHGTVNASDYSDTQTYQGTLFVHDMHDQRAAINGAIETKRTLHSNIKDLAAHMRAQLVFTQGQWQCDIEQAGASAFSFNESNLIGKFEYDSGPKKDKLNQVKVKYINPEKDWEGDTATADSPADFAADNNTLLKAEIGLPYETDYFRAYNFGNVELKKSRDQGKAKFTADKAAAQLVAGNIVDITHPVYGFSNKLFRIESLELPENGLPQIIAREHFDSFYDEAVPPGVQTPPDSIAQNPFEVSPPSNLQAFSGDNELFLQSDGTIVSRVRLTWDGSPDPFLEAYDIQWKKAADTDWINGPKVPDSGAVSAIFAGPEDGTLIDVRLRAANHLAAKSEWVSIQHTFLGKAAPPPDVENFRVKRQPDGTREFSWTYSNPPKDLKGFEIRVRLGTGQGWGWNDLSEINGGIKVHTGVLLASPWETNQLAAGGYTAAIKAVDTSGNYSTNAVLIESTLGDPRIENILDQIDVFTLGWPGTLTNCWKDSSGILYAKDQKTWADFATDGITWATWTSWARNPYLSITYEHSVIDVGVITPFIPLVSVISNGTVTIEESHSDDGVSYSTWATAGTLVTARYIKIRITVTISSGLITVNDMDIILSAQTVVEDIEDLSTSTLSGAYRLGVGDVRLPITQSYALIKRVDVALQNVGSGWSWELIDKNTSTGPRIKIYNGSSPADAVIDATVKGV